MQKLKGILYALVTPLREDESVDTEAAARITQSVAAGGSDGLIALGSTGEQIAMTREAKRDMIAAVKKAMPGGMPLIAGCGAASTKLAIQNCLDAAELGADAVIVTPPCFYPFDDDGLVKYYSELADASPVPVFLYNISRYTKTKISPSTVRRLLEHPKIVGIKESDRDEMYLMELLALSRAREDFTVLQGSDRLFLTSFQRGCPAGVTVVGNLAPGVAPALYRAFQEGDMVRAEVLQQRLLEYVAVITMYGRFPLELKTAMSYCGLCSPRAVSPFVPLTEEMEMGLRAALHNLEA